MVEHSDESVDGDSSLRNNAGPNCPTTRHGQYAQSLASTQETDEEEHEYSDGSANESSNDVAARDRSSDDGGNGRNETKKGVGDRRRQSSGTSTSPASEETSITFESGDGGDHGKERGAAREHHHRIGVEPLPGPSLVDWEVAVVMASKNANDMVKPTS